MSVHSSLPPTAILSSASASSSTFPSRPALYRDALTTVLAFLSLRELAAALSVAKEWRAAVSSMRPAMLTADSSFEPLDTLLSSSSSLLRHVVQLGEQDDALSLRANQLAAPCHSFPQLRSLSTRLNMQSRGASLLFPPQLQQLHLFLNNWPDDANETATALLTAIGQLQQLHTLHLSTRYEAVSLAPLQQLPLLRDLELHVPIPIRLEQFAADLHALPLLHLLRIHLPFTAEQASRASLFTALLRDVPEEELRTLQWRDFSIVYLEFTDELTPLLLRLPLLERLEGDLSSCSRFDFLTALPRLTHLDAHLRNMRADAWRNLLRVFTSDGLARLQTLKLDSGPCSSDDLMFLLSHTPSLTCLTLGRLDKVYSLSFFCQLPKLSETLTHLLVKCTNSWCLTAADLPPLHALQQLRMLRLLMWTSEGPDMLTAADCAPFEQRPCSVLPCLEVFEWTMHG
jgi:hypothetical protein